jgi:hypothetical protein
MTRLLATQFISHYIKVDDDLRATIKRRLVNELASKWLNEHKGPLILNQPQVIMHGEASKIMFAAPMPAVDLYQVTGYVPDVQAQDVATTLVSHHQVMQMIWAFDAKHLTFPNTLLLPAGHRLVEPSEWLFGGYRALDKPHTFNNPAKYCDLTVIGNAHTLAVALL